MKIKYRWKPNARTKIKPAIAAKELERIRKSRGILQPETVVEEASNPQNPLHGFFVWDDTEAARQYRLWQARHLISVLVVVRADDDSEEPLCVRAYAHFKGDEDEDGESHYVNIIEGMSDHVMRERILADALKELAAFRKKYADLREFSALFKVIDDLNK